MALLLRLLVCVLGLCVAACGVEPSVSSVPADWTEEPAQSVPSDDEDPSCVPNGEDSADNTDEDADVESTDDEDSGSGDLSDDEPETGLTPCDIAWGLFSQCEPPPEGCEESAVGECILAIGPAVSGYCDVVSGEPCVGGQLSDSAAEYCQIRSCLGDDYDTCMSELGSSCVSESCEELDALVGHCTGYDYACESAPQAESQCLLNVFETMNQPCGLFVDAPQCALGTVTETGWGSCQVQQCLNLTTFEACYSNLEILCSFSSP
jgi:hypothetical protein